MRILLAHLHSKLFWSQVVCSFVNFLHFHLLLQNSWANFKLGTKHPWINGIQVYSNERPRRSTKGDNYEIVEIHWRNFVSSPPDSQGVNFNQTWHKVSSGEGDSSLFAFSQGEIIAKERKYTWTQFRNLLQNHWSHFNQTWHEASLGERNLSFVQMKGHAIFQGEIITK